LVDHFATIVVYQWLTEQGPFYQGFWPRAAPLSAVEMGGCAELVYHFLREPEARSSIRPYTSTP
jgi:hypothetical protein